MADSRENTRSGGWGWLLLPVVVMMVGSNLWFGGFFFATQSVEEAARRTLSIGPVVWSINQVFLLIIGVWRLRTSRIPVAEVLGAPIPTRKDVVQGLGGAVVGAAIIVIALSAQNSPLGSPGWPTWALVYWTAVASWTAAFGEEIYFRGFLFSRLGRFKPWLIVLLSSAAFAAWHVSPGMLVHTFLVGLWFGGMVLATGRVWPAILAHGGTNMIGGVGMLLNLW